MAAAAALLVMVVLPTPNVARAQSGEITFLDRNQAVPGVIDGDLRPVGLRFFAANLPPAVAQWSVRVTSGSAPLGVFVPANRVARNAFSYEGSFRLSRVATNPAAGVVKIADGDRIVLTYTDPAPQSGEPSSYTASATWRAQSEEPDFRELTYNRPAVGQDVVFGAPGAAGHGSQVRIYRTEDAAAPLTTTTARADGSFTGSFSGPEDIPNLLWVSTVERDLPESARVEVVRSSIAGRVVAPADDGTAPAPVHYAFAQSYAPGSREDSLSTLTARDGRFDLGGDFLPNPMDVGVSPSQGEVQGGARTHWSWESYGMPARRRTTFAAPGLTRDLGDVSLVAPNVVMHVTDGMGFDVAQAYVSEPSTFNSDNPVDTFTRVDGRFGLHLADGTHRLRVQSPHGCAIADTKYVDVTVDDGRMTSSANRVVLEPFEPVDAAVTVPVAPPRGGGPLELSVDASAGDIGLRLDDPAGRGTISAGCPGETTTVPTVNVVNPGVDLGSRRIEFTAARVCLSYTNQRLRRRGLRESQLQVLRWPHEGRVRVVTTRRLPGQNEICGRAPGFGAFAVGVKLPRPRLSLAASDPTVREGDRTRLYGRLARSNGRPLADRRVVVQWRRVGRSRWHPLASRLTSSRGRFSVRTRPDAAMHYRARFAGNRRWAPATSALARVSVRRVR